MLTDRDIEKAQARLVKMLQGRAKPGRKPKVPLPPAPAKSRAHLPTYDAEKGVATLAGGVTIRIDPQDAPLLHLGGWRYSDRNGVFCQREVSGQRQFFFLAVLVLQASGNQLAGIDGGAVSYLVYDNGEKTDLRRENLGLRHAKKVCPFSSARLRALYHEERKTLEQIAALTAVDAIGLPPVSRETVRRWLKEANLPLRSEAKPPRHDGI